MVKKMVGQQSPKCTKINCLYHLLCWMFLHCESNIALRNNILQLFIQNPKGYNYFLTNIVFSHVYPRSHKLYLSTEYRYLKGSPESLLQTTCRQVAGLRKKGLQNRHRCCPPSSQCCGITSSFTNNPQLVCMKAWHKLHSRKYCLMFSFLIWKLTLWIFKLLWTVRLPWPYWAPQLPFPWSRGLACWTSHGTGTHSNGSHKVARTLLTS